jgi:electron transport complex protein RnfB
MTDAERLNQLLPQTQCTRCGYPDCASYAQAMAEGHADINQCPPGGDEGVRRLADATGRPYRPLNLEHGQEGPRQLAIIDETWCIGCTLCLQACPVDSILGANKRMHTVIEDLCTGCELCIPVCPVDCISLVPAHAAPAPTGWAAWSAPEAQQARRRYETRTVRVVRQRADNEARLQAKAEAKLANLAEASKLTEPAELDRKRAVIEAALARARARRGEPPAST